MTKIIAVVNQKGGVAKTTTTNALGIGLARKGYKVLLVDLDPQGNLSMSLGIDFPDTEDYTTAQAMLEVLQGKADDICLDKYIRTMHGVDFLIGNDDLGKIERMLPGSRDAEYTLDTILESIKDVYNYIIIDCMPSVGALTDNALIVADEVIIPTEPQFFSVKGIQHLLHDISAVQQRKNPKLKISGILPTKVDIQTKVAQGFLQALSDVFGDSINIFSLIPKSTKIAECNTGINLYEYDPSGKGVKAYENFVNEFLG